MPQASGVLQPAPDISFEDIPGRKLTACSRASYRPHPMPPSCVLPPNCAATTAQFGQAVAVFARLAKLTSAQAAAEEYQELGCCSNCVRCRQARVGSVRADADSCRPQAQLCCHYVKPSTNTIYCDTICRRANIMKPWSFSGAET